MGVTGIGGFVFRAEDPEALKAWYAEHLGIGSGLHGVSDMQAGPSVFAPLPADTDVIPAGSGWMLNLRVDDLDGLCDALRAAGIETTTNPDWDAPGVGRCSAARRSGGNPVELWEPDAAD